MHQSTQLSHQPPHADTAQRTLYLGPDLSFSYAAAHAVCPDSTLVQCSSFDEIFTRLQRSSGNDTAYDTSSESAHYDYAIVPVVNSTNGQVVPVVDLVRRSGDGTLLQQLTDRGVKGLDVSHSDTSDPASTASEYTPTGLDASQHPPHPTSTPSTYPNIALRPPYTYDLAVHHYLYVHPACPLPAITDSPSGTPTPSLPTIFFNPITSLHTHPQVWTQCRHFLSTYFPSTGSGGATQHDHPSTSAASLYVSQHGSEGGKDKDEHGFPAAICSRLAGEARGLKCVAAHIEDDTAGNATTFVVLGVATGPN